MSKPEKVWTHGFTAVDNKLFYLQERLSPNAFCLLIRIYRMTNGYDGHAKPLANAYLQKLCNMSKNTVTKALKELDALGLLFIKRQQRSTTFYAINHAKVDSLFAEIKLKNDGQNMGLEVNNEVLESQDMTNQIPRYDQVDGQDMGSTKEKEKKSNKENLHDDQASIVDFESDYSLAKSVLMQAGILKIGEPVNDDELRPEIYRCLSWAEEKKLEANQKKRIFVSWFQKMPMADRRRFFETEAAPKAEAGLARPHSGRSDSFEQNNQPTTLTREQQLEADRLAMQSAGVY